MFAADINLRVYCTVYHKPSYFSHNGKLEIPRLWVTLDKEIIFDWAKDFEKMTIQTSEDSCGQRPVYWCDISGITAFIQEYIETPVDELIDKTFETDLFGFADILKAADRRIGKKKLLLLLDKTQCQAAKMVIAKRTA